MFEEKRKKELEAIKNIDPELIISDLNIRVAKKSSNYYLCYAPYRPDRNPSFTIFYSSSNWKWKDHSTGQFGSWIDLYMLVNNCDYITAIRELREKFLYSDDFKINSSSKPINQTQTDWELLEVKESDIKRKVIKDFLKNERKIDHIPDWIKEVNYEVYHKRTGEVKKYFGFGVVDVAGNYHIRFATSNSKVKERVLSTSEKEKTTYSLIRKNSDKVVVVEGFIDAIRVDELFNDCDILILNSVENVEKALKEIKKYKEIVLGLDNDNAGDKAKNVIKNYIVDNVLNVEVFEFVFNAKDIDEAVKNNKNIDVVDITDELKKNENGITINIYGQKKGIGFEREK